MGEHQIERKQSGSLLAIRRSLLIGSILLYLGLLLFNPSSSTLGEYIDRDISSILQAENVIYLPIVYRNFSSTPGTGPTSTSTSTSTSTLTPTGTPPTSTPTSTPTITGTPPTPTWTATGTLVANPRLIITVSPFQANVGDRFTFTIEVTNIGTTTAMDGILTDSFPDFIDVESVTTSKGNASRAIHSVSVNIGTISPGEKITITIVVRANSRKLTTETVTNTVTLYYDENGIRTAATSYRIIVSTLPGTGDLPLDWENASKDPLLTLQVFFMIVLGLTLAGLGVRAWKRGSSNRHWMLGIGFILLVVSSISLFTEIRDQAPRGDSSQVEFMTGSSDENVSQQVPNSPAATPSLPARLPAYLFATPESFVIETLPSYPIPTPDVTFTPVPEIEEPDTSAVERIIIPAILLDTEVKYVPFVGGTWLIRGLRYEVAWLGDTSWPGLGSNTVLAGHVTVSGIGNGPFRKLEELGDGEFIFLRTEENSYTYRVRGRKIVEDWDLSVVAPSISPQLTLITCVEWDDEEDIYVKRLVLFADLVRVDPMLESSSN